MPLQRRLPKRGFKNIFKKRYAIVNVRDLNRFAAGEVVDIDALRRVGLIKKAPAGVKVIGDGEIKIPLTVRAHAFSAAARRKIEAASGRAEEV